MCASSLPSVPPPSPGLDMLGQSSPTQVVAAQALLAMAAREVARLEREDPECAGIVVQVYADGSVDVQLLNGQAVPVGGYSL